MKKILKLIVLIVALFSVNLMVSASDKPFIHDWNTESRYEPGEFGLIYNSKIFYKNTYIESLLEMEESLDEEKLHGRIIKYAINGKELVNVALDNRVVMDMNTDNIYLYILAIDYDMNLYFLMLDENLKTIKEIKLVLEEDDYLSPYYGMMNKLNDIKISKYENNKFYFLSNKYINELDLKTNNINKIDSTEENMKKYYKEYSKLLEKQNETDNIIGYDFLGTKEVYTGMRTYDCDVVNPILTSPKKATSTENLLNLSILNAHCTNYKALITLYDNNKKVFEKEVPDYNIIGSPHIIDEYIVTIGVGANADNSSINIEVLIFNMNGEIVQKITTTNYYYEIKKGPTSFMVLGMDTAEDSYCDHLMEDIDGDNDSIVIIPKCAKLKHEVYYLPQNIKTKVVGEGTITVNNTSRVGEEITFNITPQKGFEIKDIKVTDENGNVISFTDYKFIMPHSDVLIEVNFVKSEKNPETTDIRLLIITTILLISGIAIIFNIKNQIKMESI